MPELVDASFRINLNGKTYEIHDVLDITWDGAADDVNSFFEAETFTVMTEDLEDHEVNRSDLDYQTELLLNEWVQTL